MITGATRGRGGGGLGRHLSADDAQPGESRGLIAEGIRDQIAELTKMASRAEHMRPLYHTFARPPDGSEWKAEDFARYWELFEAEFGLERQPFSTADHGDHQHRAYSLVKGNGACIRMDHDYARREKIARIVEVERGERLTPGAHNRAVIARLDAERPDVAAAMRAASLDQGPRPIAGITPKDRHQQERTCIDKKEVAAMTAAAWRSSDGPAAFMAALKEQGMRLAAGDRTTLVVDATGNSHSLSRLLAMHARAAGDPPQRAADVAQRMQGTALPSLADARAEIRTAVPSEPPQPPSPPPAGGPPAGQEKGSLAGAAPFRGAGIPASPGGRPAASAAGGASTASASQDSPRPAASLEDAGPGPGERPGPGASPDEIARYRKALAAYQARKDAAWFAWLKSQMAQERKGGSAPAPAGGASDVRLVQEERGPDAFQQFAARIIAAAEREAARRTVAAAISSIARSGSDRSPAMENDGRRCEDGSPGERQGGGDAGRDDAATGPRISGPHPRDDRPHADHHGDADAHRARTGRNPLINAAEAARLNTALAIADMSTMRAAAAAMTGIHAPMVTMSRDEKKEALRTWRQDLVALYREDGAVLREEGRADWRDSLAAERVRTHPAAEALRRNWRHLSPDERAAGWQTIREARETLTDTMRQEAQARPKRDFSRWLEFVASYDPKAAAVLLDMREKHAREQAIKEALEKEETRIAAIRASAPQGERNPDAAAQIEKDKLRQEHARAVEMARTAAAEAEAAKARIGIMDRIGQAFGWAIGWKPPAVRAAAEAEKDAAMAAAAAAERLPRPADFRAATVEGREVAERNQKAYAGWQARTGQEADRRDALLTGIRDALADGDPKMRAAILTGGIDAAMKLQAARDAEDQRRRDEADRLTRGNVIPMRGAAQGAAPAPRMR